MVLRAKALTIQTQTTMYHPTMAYVAIDHIPLENCATMAVARATLAHHAATTVFPFATMIARMLEMAVHGLRLLFNAPPWLSHVPHWTSNLPPCSPNGPCNLWHWPQWPLQPRETDICCCHHGRSTCHNGCQSCNEHTLPRWMQPVPQWSDHVAAWSRHCGQTPMGAANGTVAMQFDTKRCGPYTTHSSN